MTGQAGHRTQLIDCRFLGSTGIGRVTEWLLQGLAELAPPGRWILWGPPAVERYRWPDARCELTEESPFAWAGQRSAGRVPPADHLLFLHAIRPMTRRPSTVLVHDTIPLRWSPRWWERALWRQYFRLSARTAQQVWVYSGATWQRVVDDLGVTPTAQLSLPVDAARAERIRSLRARRPAGGPGPSGAVLYVGRVRPHKNLARAMEAFASSECARAGGRFTIVGADDRGRDLLSGALRRWGRHVEVLGHCTDDELDRRYAEAACVIQPSLEEGLGLTVTESLAAGIPVCCSDLSPLREAADGAAELFDPFSVAAITEALNRTIRRAAHGEAPQPAQRPTPRQFAQQVVALLEQAPASTARHRLS